VGQYAGAEAVGQVALTIRLVEQPSSLMLVVSMRLSIPVFARLQGDRARLVKVVTEGMSLQLMVMGPLLAGFGLVAPWIIPLMLGPQWLPVLEVYPFIAASSLGSAVLGLHVAVLYVLQKNWKVVFSYLVYIVLFTSLALLLVPRLGLTGYGWAVVMVLPSLCLPLIIWVRVYMGRLRYTEAGIWYTAWAVPLFSWQLSPWVWISVLVPLIWPPTRRELVAILEATFRRIRAGWPTRD
jgi:PST family polysaccharide transporter